MMCSPYKVVSATLFEHPPPSNTKLQTAFNHFSTCIQESPSYNWQSDQIRFGAFDSTVGPALQSCIPSNTLYYFDFHTRLSGGYFSSLPEVEISSPSAS